MEMNEERLQVVKADLNLLVEKVRQFDTLRTQGADIQLMNVAYGEMRAAISGLASRLKCVESAVIVQMQSYEYWTNV